MHLLRFVGIAATAGAASNAYQSKDEELQAEREVALGAGRDADGRAGALWAILRRLTGLTDDELRSASEELARLPPPSQRSVWMKSVHCEAGTCAGEAVARLVSSLGESGLMPLRAFEPFKGDPLYKHWKEMDKQPFHSWADGKADSATLERLVPEGQPLVIPRLQAAEFFMQARDKITSIVRTQIPGFLGRCLEWDTPFYIVKGFGEWCYKRDVLTYANKGAGTKEEVLDFQGGSRWIATDITNLPEWMPGDYGVIVCLFVLEHVTEPHAAMRGLVRMLAPGGFLMLGAPFIDGVHACPDDYFRYTPHGLRRLAEDAGLEVLLTFSPGSPPIAAGELVGMKSSYWSQDDLFAESDTHPLNVFLLARRHIRSRIWRPARRNDSSADFDGQRRAPWDPKSTQRASG